jgi:outer membrane protein W
LWGHDLLLVWGESYIATILILAAKERRDLSSCVWTGFCLLSTITFFEGEEMTRSILRGLFFVLFFFVVLFFAIEANAENTYFELKPGAYFPQKGIMKDADIGIGMELALGYYFHPNIAAEFGIGDYYTRVPVFLGIGSDRVKTSTNVAPITLDLVLSNRMGSFEPYVKAGIGEYLVFMEKVLGGSETKSAFGYQFGLGAVFNNIGIEGKYFFAEPTLLNTKVKLDGFTATVFYKFRF